MIQPTVGRIVYYKSRGSADGIFPSKDVPSMITEINEDGSIALVTFYKIGMRFESSCTQGQELGQWDWMPFQKDQQARLAPETTNESQASAQDASAPAPAGISA